MGVYENICACGGSTPKQGTVRTTYDIAPPDESRHHGLIWRNVHTRALTAIPMLPVRTITVFSRLLALTNNREPAKSAKLLLQ